MMFFGGVVMGFVMGVVAGWAATLLYVIYRIGTRR